MSWAEACGYGALVSGALLLVGALVFLALHS